MASFVKSFITLNNISNLIIIWDSFGIPIQSLTRHTSWAMGISFSPDGKHLASCSFDKTVRIWDVETGLPTQTIEGREGIGAICYSADGNLVATCSNQCIKI